MTSEGIPLTQQQWAVWASQQLRPDSDAYNVPVGYRLSGSVDPTALEAAFRSVVERHPVLRVTVRARPDGSVLQEVREVPDRVLTVHDVTGNALEEELARVVSLPFGPDAACRLRAHLLRLAPERYVLVMVFDHIVVDAPSVARITDDLATGYAAALDGGASGPATVEARYFAYARDQRAFFATQEAEALGDFWHTYLDGLSGLTAAAGSRADTRPPLASSLPVLIPAGLAASAERLGTTPTALLMAALSLTTRHFLRSTDTVISYPAVDWRRMEYEPVVGLFTDMLAFRCPPEESRSLQEYVRAVHGAMLECLGRHGAPLTKFRSRLRAAHPAGIGSPPVMLSVNNVPGTGELRLRGLAVEWFPLRPAHNKADLVLSVYVRNSGTTARLDYDTEAYGPETARRFGAAFQEVVGQIVSGWDGPATAVELTGEDDRSLLLGAWNPPVPEAPAWNVAAAFAARAAAAPGAVALVADGRETTYRELEADSRALGAALTALGLPAGSVVAICLPRSARFVTAVLAVLRSGLAFLPVDVEQPERRRAFLLADAGAAAVVVAGPGDEALLTGLPVVDMCEAVADAPFRDAEPHGEDPAYLITTSGSSGLPKTVVIPHRAIANHLRWKAAAFGFGPEDCFYFKTPQIFDASVWEYLLPLTVGARVVVAPSSAHRDPALLLSEMSRYAVGVVQFVPTVLKAVLAEPDAGDHAALKWVFVGGEPLGSRVAEETRRRTGARVVNLYGPTEATIDATYHEVAPDGRDEDRPVPIGRPIGGGQAYVLGRGGQLLPPGFTGELHLGGLPLATGYAHREQLTRERFVPAPAGTGLDTLLYRTGDLARFRPDGAIEFLGREDTETKVRGIRVDLAGLGALIGALPGVRDAVVTVPPGRDDALVAYLVADPAVTDDAVLAHCAERLPRELLPSTLVRLDRIPVTATGKTDVRALPVPPTGRAPGAGTEPRSAFEGRLRSLWAEVLGVAPERVPRDVSLFALGGSSLTLLRLHQRIRADISPGATVTDLFKYPTVAALADALDDSGRTSGLVPAPTGGKG
ncbi:amino acid adenylation domain-containing protein [Streptomyces sp. NBC_01335]|uniref:non-ribosomal peptide synthetase n=1 Tax=Streptomyces sp. NBC_01335 TaxID=2903828 RepID=UPI002E152347|nr:amino acid adenylation domain-containing protein [Streptomyces sp. NBC_01335]